MQKKSSKKILSNKKKKFLPKIYFCIRKICIENWEKNVEKSWYLDNIAKIIGGFAKYTIC